MQERTKRFLPFSATFGNLAAGVIACALAAEGYVEFGGLMIVIGVLLDSVDGPLARRLSVSSEFGGELDSLADMVTFGIAPVILVGALMPADELDLFGWGLIIFFPICAAWRLARFNASNETDSPTHAAFKGLPTTGAGGASAAAALVHCNLMERGISLGANFLPWIMVLLAFMMVSDFAYAHLACIIARMSTPLLVVLAAGVIAAMFFWHYELVFALLFWSYVVSGPAGAVRERFRASLTTPR